MDRTTIDRLRKLRKRSKDLSRTIRDDLESFRHERDEITFRRLPDSESKDNDVGVTTTCSCLMALTMSGKLNVFYKDTAKIKEAFDLVMKGDKDGKWKSSGLPDSNTFTTTLVIRAFGFLKQIGAPGITSSSDYERDKYRGIADRSLDGIINYLSENIKTRFRINKYPATPAVVYWFIDGIQRAEINLGNKWKQICIWASRSFLCQLSRVSAKDAALMDPIAMAMAACLSVKLRNIAKGAKLGATPSLLDTLPSLTELKNSIHILFENFRSECGIWPKYFPLFHYGTEAGSNYCFTFEMLEAILNEFGDEIILDEESDIVLCGLEEAVQWCYNNRLDYLENTTNISYSGWNSGGQLQTLEAGKPESWATAVVHMFLHTLQEVLTNRIENLILSHYDAEEYDKVDSQEWDRLLDIDLEFEYDDKKVTLKEILDQEMLSTITIGDRKHFRNNFIKDSCSALLFGPPGTSKTVLVKAIAQKLGWPYISIDPSRFLKEGLENIYSEADNVFRDLSDLSGTVLLFDEMDALVQTRDENEGCNLDVTSRFLTTSMLPKLAALHDNGRSLFFMATNYPEQFDQAIKRPGRFDLLLGTWPPSWKTKLERLDIFYKESDVDECKKILREYVDGTPQKDVLEMFTYLEMKAFIKNLKGTSSLKRRLEDLEKNDFLATVDKWAKCITLNVSTNKKITEKYIEGRKGSRVQP